VLRRDKGSNEKVLVPVHPNAGTRQAYQRKLLALTDAMAHSYVYWLRACYRANEPVLAQDSPASELEKTLKQLGRYWLKRFSAAAPELAEWFAQDVDKRSSAALRSILRRGGISVRFRMTKAMRDVLDASVAESVGLIRSIPQQYHTEVEGLVMRSVKAGRKLDVLTRELKQRYGVTRKRAALIARDQNNKTTAAFTRVHYGELGIEKAVWLHSTAGKEPRPTHVKNSGKAYVVSEGWFDPDPRVRKRIWPGELINCRCVAKPVVKGFS
jgi:SPP1 gp7 family putative phage head morphogenesis protein